MAKGSKKEVNWLAVAVIIMIVIGTIGSLDPSGPRPKSDFNIGWSLPALRLD